MNRNSRQGQGGGGVVRESRPHDYIYDPNYTICSQKDFYKEAAIGARSGARLKLRPVFPSMFSERLGDRIEPCLVLPRPNILENFMPQHNVMGIPVMPVADDCVYRRELDPTGADRARFISSYNPPTYFTASPQIHFDLEEEKRKNSNKHRKGFFVNRGTQTDYRESETQTDPYTPPYTLPYAGAYPKVLALLKMTWGKGLPATLEDIVVIERALMRRMLDMGAHDAEDPSDFERRVKLMEDLEAQQWADREKELNLIMEYKMKLVAKALSDLRNKSNNMITTKLEKAFEESKRNTAYELAKIRHNYLRAVRRAEDSTYNNKTKALKRNVVKEYLEFDSKVYTPLTRNGPNIDLLYTPPKYKFRDHLNIDDFNCLTEDPDFVKNELEFDKARFARRMQNAKASTKHKRLEATLASIFDVFRNETLKKAKEDETAFMRQVITSTINRMETPAIEPHDLEDEQKELCILNLQKAIRGRVVQVLMRDEIDQNMSTILQLKALHKADPFGLNTTYGQAYAQANLQADRELQQEKQNEVTEIVDQLEGETLSRMFDFLDKEMVRLLDERKIHALMILAERERRMKEATEGGRRQKEEEERQMNDEIFRQVVGIQQSTVDMYLEDMYLEAINRTADSNAREYVQGLARTINEAAYTTNKNDGDMDPEEMAADLVHSFILPELNRLSHQERLDAAAERYTRAAREVTDATIGAQAVVNETLDTLRPTINEPMERGEAVIEAIQNFVDSVIKGS